MTSSNQKKWHSLGDFLKAKEEREKEAVREEVEQTQQVAAERQVASPTPVTPVTDVTPVTPVREEVAPRRDFARVANSIVRDAIPAGIFTGKCKQLYDYLYTRTRGAIVPVRSARIPTDRVMKGAGMTRHTYRAHIHRLISFGLVEVEERPGEHGGNIYTVHLPEEVEQNRGDTRDRGDRGDTGEKLHGVQGSQAHPCHRGLSADESIVSGQSKTFFKTNTESDDDDAALAGLFAVLKAAATEVTGKGLSPSERDRWRELAEVLATELKIAAARTTVSSAPSFLTEHLRRRLWKKDKSQLQAEAASTSTATPKRTFSAEQIAKCPDCGGSGFFYPQGYEGGVAKCKHEKLEATSATDEKSSGQA
ncbi:MAG: hypothetical protein WCF57_04765 [Pyrinomonadaceae bacterium]